MDGTSSIPPDEARPQLPAAQDRVSKSGLDTRRCPERFPAPPALCSAMDYSTLIPLSRISPVSPTMPLASCARHLSPARQLRQIKLRQSLRLSRRQDPDSSHTLFQRAFARLKLRQHAAADNRSSGEILRLLGAQPGNHCSVGAFYSRHVRKKDKRVRVARRRTRSRHFIGVHVVVLAVCSQCQRRQNRNPALLPQRLDPAGLRKANLAHKSQIIPTYHLLAGTEAHAVATAKSNRRHPCSLNRSHHLLVDHPAQHHERDIASLGIGHAQTPDEFALLPQSLQHAGKRAAAAMNHGHAMTVLRQICDRPCALAQRSEIFQRRSSDFDYDNHCNPSSSAHPYIRFMFCTACPAAPFSKLSMHDTSTSLRPSSARQNPRSQ